MNIHVLRAGPLSTVQDLGRRGQRHLGVALAGALDPQQAALANQLVGNQETAAVLEFTLQGAILRFDAPSCIALCGASIIANFECSDTRVRASIPMGRPVILPTGTLELGMIKGGVRSWLALHGGIDVPQVLGSRSTDLRGGFGGVEGRAPQAGDVLATLHPDDEAPRVQVAMHAHATVTAARPKWPTWWAETPGWQSRPVRYVPSLQVPNAPLADREWRVHPSSNRQGLRLQGHPIELIAQQQTSAPIAPGCIQLPPDGQPIVLLADAQTVGGYPRLGHVIAADLPLLAQAGPGTELRFEAVTQAQADTAFRRRQGELSRLRWAIEQRRLQVFPA